MSIGGAFIRFGGLGLRILQLCVSVIGLGIFSYFLSVLADRDLPIRNRWSAVEGITGAATLYALIACLAVLFLGGKTFFGYLAVVLDILFAGAFIAVAWNTRHGANSCTGNVSTPLGDGPADSNSPGYGSNGFGFGNDENSTYAPNLHWACVLNTVVFAVAILAIFLFLISAAWNILMVRHHQKEKKFGPSPANNYTSGSGKTPFWKRGNKTHHTKSVETAGVVAPAKTPFWKRGNKTHTTRDIESAGVVGSTHPTGTAVRPSHETGTTLVGNNQYATEPKFGQPGYGHTGTVYDRTTF